MSISEMLSDEEREELRELVGQFSARAHHQMTIDSLIGDWTRFVEAVEQGRDDSIYEYTNDLSVRDLLERVLAQGSTPVAAKVAAIIHPIDIRFLRHTRPVATPVLRGSDAFWWRRIPTRLGDELRQDLLADGIIEDA